VTVRLPKFLAAVEERLNGSKSHIVGDSMTIADIRLAAFAFSYLYSGGLKEEIKIQEVLAHFSVASTYFESLRAIFKDYLSSRKECEV